MTSDGFCYSNNDIKKLVNTRSQSADRRARGDVNRIYASKEAYLGTLYDVILGYIDPNRFITMEKVLLHSGCQMEQASLYVIICFQRVTRAR